MFGKDFKFEKDDTKDITFDLKLKIEQQEKEKEIEKKISRGIYKDCSQCDYYDDFDGFCYINTALIDNTSEAVSCTSYR